MIGDSSMSSSVTSQRYCDVNTSPMRTSFPMMSLKILFRSNGQITDRGFNMTYGTSPCGGEVGGPRAVIASTNYPNNYDNGLACTWRLQFAEGSQIKVS